MADFDRDLKMILRDNGCYYQRPADGSHEWWYSPITKRHFFRSAPYQKQQTLSSNKPGLVKGFNH